MRIAPPAGSPLQGTFPGTRFVQAIGTWSDPSCQGARIAPEGRLLGGLLGFGQCRIFDGRRPAPAPMMVWLDARDRPGSGLEPSNTLPGKAANGLALDDTFPFFHNFRWYHTGTQEAAHAARRTMPGTGRAIPFTTLLRVTGFRAGVVRRADRPEPVRLPDRRHAARRPVGRRSAGPAPPAHTLSAARGRQIPRRWGLAAGALT